MPVFAGVEVAVTKNRRVALSAALAATLVFRQKVWRVHD